MKETIEVVVTLCVLLAAMIVTGSLTLKYAVFPLFGA